MRHVRIASVLCGLALWAGAAMAADEGPSAGECFAKGFEASDADAVAVFGPDSILGTGHIKAGELIPGRLLAPTEIQQILERTT